jgi:hypothetical protein
MRRCRWVFAVLVFYCGSLGQRLPLMVLGRGKWCPILGRHFWEVRSVGFLGVFRGSITLVGFLGVL